MWAPWTTSRVKSILPLLTGVAGRGVNTVLFVRDPGDIARRLARSGIGKSTTKSIRRTNAGSMLCPRFVASTARPSK